MNFVVAMALREIRASWQRLLFFFICIAVGVAAIVAIRSLIQSVRAGLTQESQTLIGGDILVTSNRPFTPDVLDTISRERAAGRIWAASRAMEIATMVRPDGKTGTKMVELRAVDAAFPLYGTLTLQQGTYSHAMLRDHGALVRPELLAQLGLHIGDTILIGKEPFQIRGVIASEPGRNLGAFTLGPRVMIDYVDLASTGLLSFASRSSQQLLLKVPPTSVPTLADDLRSAFRNDFVGVRGYWQNADRIGENLTRAENYLSL